MFWCAFNTSINSPTRCELGAAIISMLQVVALKIGTDNAAVVGIATKNIDHETRKGEAVLRGEKGQFKLGGAISPLHRNTPFKRQWESFKSSGLWQIYQRSIQQRGTGKTELRKVKGPATEEMRETGKYDRKEKRGNGNSDEAAGKRSSISQELTKKGLRCMGGGRRDTEIQWQGSSSSL